MQVVYLIRHGETGHNRDGRVQGQTESELSELGREQARLVGERLRGVDFIKAFSSPRLRAVETHRIALDGSVPVETHDGLSEIRLGAWEGEKAADLRKKYPEDVKRWFHNPSEVHIEGAETIRGFRQRVARAMTGIRRANPEGTLAVFAHGGVICVYLTHLLGMKLDDIWRFKIRNCSVTRVVFPQDKPRIDLLGDVHHLKGALRELPARTFRIFP